MQKAILALLILILGIILSVSIYFINKLNQLSIEIEKALLVIQEIQLYIPKIEEIVDNFQQLEPLFESLNKLSDIISLLTDPLGSEG
ncbi:MAG: hypothetical protein VYD43_03250 [Actinomycetota bacterium]|nr:hypothetical protein [Actinomycetota bacterium]